MGSTYINLESLMEMLLEELKTGKKGVSLAVTRRDCPFGSMRVMVKRVGEDDLVLRECYQARLAEPFVRAFRSRDQKVLERIYSEMLKER